MLLSGSKMSVITFCGRDIDIPISEMVSSSSGEMLMFVSGNSTGSAVLAVDLELSCKYDNSCALDR